MLDVEVQQALTTLGRVSAIAAEPGTAEDRGREILEEIGRLIPFEAAELTMLNPLDGSVEEVTATGYEAEVLDGLRSQRFLDLMDTLDLPRTGIPVRMKDLPGEIYDNWAVSELLLPAGYSEGMTMALRTDDGRFTGVLNLSTTSQEHPSDVARAAIAQLCSALGNLVDPARSGRWLAMLLGSGSMAIGLDQVGSTVPLPGIASHPLLTEGTDLVITAQSSAGMRAWNSFIWPDDDDWFRVRVVPCAGEGHISAVVSLDAIDLGPLSRRELEVLTLAAEGLSNSEIGDALVISGRTVGTHVEHVLDKMGAPNRAAAVAAAIREGLLLGRVERHDGR
jgi:DNA-binding CsgD family transcriptional regulator